ncbi:excinuclease ABC subunit A [Shewanella saliphila]|uniref:UvrABC system protein A n=1 Tax=Shewanella saliphila TaxID=2282698 RepID=A0ABQ2QB98_9GAMM|nr:excinuclease ABC subunit A [Shewanella saliphila]
MKSINIINARQNNLKSVDIQIPRNQIVVFTGVSGSGKSSLVFETINAEAQRQLYDTLGTYAQSHLPKVPKPDCDLIENISPAIVIKQKRSLGSSRSTVGTTTEIYTYLRLLFSRIGTPLIGASSHFSFNSPEGMCLSCNGTGQIMDIDIDKMLDTSKSLNEGAILFPDFKVGGWQWKYIALAGQFDCDLPVNQFTQEDYQKLLYGFEENIAINTGDLRLDITYEGVIVKINRLYVHKNQDTLSKKKKQIIEQYLSVQDCHTCHGARLNQQALSVKINGYNIDQVSHFDIEHLKQFVDTIDEPHANTIIEQIDNKISHLIDIGLGYLSLSRDISTLSGGEAQRIKLAKQLGSSLTEMLYILDEPSVGLHPKDVHHLNNLLFSLRDKGNSVLVVEHDPDVIKIVDHVIDVGPKAGLNGGQIVFQGTYHELLTSEGATGKLLSQSTSIKSRVRQALSHFEIKNATANNLRNVNVNIPKGIMTCVTGVAGSGKSSLIHHEFLYRYPDAIVIDQSAVGQSERSNAATYTGLFDEIRKVYAKANNVKPSVFSFNSEGACSHCKGLGFVEMEMAFLDPIRTQCSECEGKRYNEATLKYQYQGLNIAELLELTIDKAVGLFNQEKITKRIKVLQQVGLGYLTMGQPLASLSGGECQRVKLSSELHKTGNVYVLDEPTTGLHVSDANKIIEILNELAARGNTVIIIEHNLDVMTQADWIIDVGPDGGDKGGQLMFEGTPKALIEESNSHTATYLQSYVRI